ncbi:MAG TPA: ShlB/FhaC/HecB family hemolysin secretion/activation protein [Leptolyngbyaceae cyanobacterium M65_K2018_010]|nr:ShlB/FhaC/HecB family hemolysin secretion/activation protein [Leptolyngbyaceae cyanobacterium M65_K2018_010]
MTYQPAMGIGCVGVIAWMGLSLGLPGVVWGAAAGWQDFGPPSRLTAAVAPVPEAERVAAEAVPAADLPLEPDPSTETPDPLFEVQTIVVEGSTVFSEAELAAAVRPFEGRSLTLAELQQAADAVTQLYLNAGYLTSAAVLSPQTITGGVVRLQVIEGGLEEIRVEGSDRLIPYVQQRIALANPRPVNQNRLEEQLQLLNADPLFENVEASLRQGQMPGTSILIVRVTEAPALGGSLAVDTLSPRSVGQYRTGVTLTYNNLAGLGDRLLASAYRSTTGGSYAYDLSYLVPLNPMNGTLVLRATPNNFRITDSSDPAFVLDLSGSTDSYEIQYRQPLIRTLREELALSVGFRYRQGNTLLLGLITPPTVTSVVNFNQDYLRRDVGGVWGVQSQFRLGTGLFNATNLPGPGLDAQFFSWLGQVQRLQVLGPDYRLLLQGSLQLTPDQLLPGSEQFFIGGGQSVRGYYQNERFGDNGVRFSVEGQIILQRDQEGNPLTWLFPFLDAGYVWAANPAFQPTRQNAMVGTGLGLELRPLDNLTARMDLGFPLIKLDELPSDRPAGLRVYFDLRYWF